VPIPGAPAVVTEPISDGRFPYGEVITVITRTVSGRDAEGNDVYTESSTPYIGAFDPAIGFESTNLQDQVQTQPGVYLPYVAVAGSGDAVVLQDGPHAGRYEVDGRPEWWKNPHTGWEAGCKVPLKQVSG
jgi:hypothetical protein